MPPLFMNIFYCEKKMKDTDIPHMQQLYHF